MIKIKEYPPVIDIKTIIQDRLIGAKSHKTVLKRLNELNIKIRVFDMIDTQELFEALLPNSKTEDTTPKVIIKRGYKSKTT